MKIISIVLFALTMAVAFAEEKKKSKWSSAFETDSEFMKGYETGIFLRTKGGSVEEYGCKPAEGVDSSGASNAIDTIQMAISTAKGSLPDEPMLHDALDMINEFLTSLKYFIVILTPKKGVDIDMYCTGLIFGNQGSKMLVRFANILINPIGEDGEIIPTNISPEERKKRKSKKGGEIDVLKAAGNFFKKLGETALGKNNKPSDEL